MHSIKELFKIGNGPSSSHTIGPKRAALYVLNKYPSFDKIEVILYGSLALTGKGHLTDYIIKKTLAPHKVKIIFDGLSEVPHPNTMRFIIYKNKEIIGSEEIYSIGGGSIKIKGEKASKQINIYPHKKLKDITKYCIENSLTLSQYVDSFEDKNINEYLEKIYNVMLDSINKGLNSEGTLPGSLQIKRKAKFIYNEIDNEDKNRHNLVAYAYAVSEENASGGEIVTSPTCGASGVLPAILRYAIDLDKYSHEKIIDSLKVAGLIGNIVKFNASISGAEAGCQAEVGTACAMASGFLAYLNDGDFKRIDSASEIALEHHLGLTCDPIKGYVQIPCIERNAVAALRALDAYKIASYLNNNDAKITFDLVVETMLATGKDLRSQYRETSKGGLAKKYN